MTNLPRIQVVQPTETVICLLSNCECKNKPLPAQTFYALFEEQDVVSREQQQIVRCEYACAFLTSALEVTLQELYLTQEAQNVS